MMDEQVLDREEGLARLTEYSPILKALYALKTSGIETKGIAASFDVLCDIHLVAMQPVRLCIIVLRVMGQQ